ncbi:unnamed protein product [Rotaria sordida]|uniref:Uncharacterized protein n=1 Tax=Rotaria sordida TaxID=392033 RepID=A0A814SZ42_9BILA|nr:unnamed protein product [Rotaria sordida]
MNKHIRICSGFNSSQTHFITSTETNYLQLINTSTSSPLISSSSSSSNNKTEWICSNARPLSIVEDTGFNGREPIKPVLLKAVCERSLALSSDIWSDAFRRQSYLGRTSHGIDDNWTLYSFEIFFIPFNTPNKNASNMLKKKKMKNQQLNDQIQEDEEEKMSDSEESDEDDDNNAFDAQQRPLTDQRRQHHQQKMINNISNSVTVKININQVLEDKSSPRLLQCTIIRWLSLSNCLEALLKSFQPLCEIFDERQLNKERVEKINVVLLEKIIEFLKPWKQVSTRLQTTNIPSIYVVIPGVESLKTSLQLTSNDTKLSNEKDMTLFRTREKLLMEVMFDYHPIHLMGLFLNSRTRKMKQCTDNQ